MRARWWMAIVALAGCTGGNDGPANPSAVAPTITSQPQNVAVVAGNSASFSVTASGTAPLTHQWRKNGSPVGTNASTLTIASAGAADAGSYDVVVSNSAGNVTSSTATLVVNAAVSVTIASGPSNLGTLASGTFTATVTGSSNTAVTWTVQEAGGGTVTGGGVYTAPATAGTYHVVATSVADNTKSASATVTVFAAGSLRLGQTGLPANVAATVTVTGPNGFTGSFTQRDQTLSGLALGSYTLTFPNVTVLGNTFTPVDPGPSTILEVQLNTTTLFSVAFAPVPPAGVGNIVATGSAATAHISPALALTSTGKILMVGGLTTTTEEYDPVAGTFSNAGSHGGSTGFETSAVALANGRVLFAGNGFPNGTKTSRVYDPVPRTWSATGDLVVARRRHTLTLLNNGKVLATGGSNDAGTYLASAELYDPGTGIWTATGSMANARGHHTATLLGDGKVLVVGGTNDVGLLRSAEIYDPNTGQFTAVAAQLSTGRYYHSAVMLPSGKVAIVAGGLTAVEVFDPGPATFTTVGTLVLNHQYAGVTLLPDGRLFVTGGLGSGDAIATTELFNPVTGAVTFGPNLLVTRQEHATILLANGKVLIVGGRGTNNVNRLTAELYTP